MRDDETAELEALEVVHETERALLVIIEGVDGSVWVPKSVIHDDSEVYSKRSGAESSLLVVKRWWAEKEGLL